MRVARRTEHCKDPNSTYQVVTKVLFPDDRGGDYGFHSQMALVLAPHICVITDGTSSQSIFKSALSQLLATKSSTGLNNFDLTTFSVFGGERLTKSELRWDF